jgi:hypothetical protein
MEIEGEAKMRERQPHSGIRIARPVVGFGALLAFMVGAPAAVSQLGQDESNADIMRRLVPDLAAAVPAQRPTAVQDSPGELTEVRFEGDFNEDGQEDLLLLGHHQEEGEQRGFALLATEAVTGEWERVQVLEFENDVAVGKRYEARPNDIAIFFCLKCDHGGWIEWEGDQYAFSHFAPVGVRE